jgi:hypothetical protein
MKTTRNTQSDQIQNKAAANPPERHSGGLSAVSHNPLAVTQRRIAQVVEHSPRMVAQRRQWASLFGPAVQRAPMPEEELTQGKFETAQRIGPDEEDLTQGKFETAQRIGPGEEELAQGKFNPVQMRGPDDEDIAQGRFASSAPAQLEEKPAPAGNNTGLPDNLKSGIENLSGLSMDDVKVHYRSDKPRQLQALAYTQGTDIHVAPGQEQHLAHEAWHVVQQKEGRVKPTTWMQGTAVNDEVGLEKEADRMGGEAVQKSGIRGRSASATVQRKNRYGADSDSIAASFESPAQLVEISGSRIYPTGKSGKALWEYVKDRLPYPHGIKKYFLQFLSADQKYDSNVDFADAFVNWLSQQTKETKKGTKPVLRTELSLRRPGWPKDYKEKLGFEPGDNIRHVVRNATLKNALDKEYRLLSAHYDENLLRNYYRDMYKGLLGNDPGNMHPIQIVEYIYKSAYLHLGNLFAGPGGDNQLIGLSADPITKKGEELVAKGEEQVNIVIAFVEAMNVVRDIKLKNSGLNEQAEPLKKLVIGLLGEMCEEYQKLDDGEETKTAAAQDIGYDLIDIGMSMGFDLIDERGEDVDPVRQKNLLQVEMALQNEQWEPGTHQLTKIIALFLSIS